jgi:glycosyltransferase involved in cell wall biosynthesis
MRIAVVHSYYSKRMPSGENTIVDLQVEALRRAGHDVIVLGCRQEVVEQSPTYQFRAAWRVATNHGVAPTEDLKRFAPHIVHVHNLFPNLSRSWAREFAPRLVVTLHNYRPICAAATLTRDSKPCTQCPDRHSALPALLHRCFKNSAVATLPLVFGTRFERDPLLASAARIITINDDMRARYASVGLPPDRIVTVPNFVHGADTLNAHDGDANGDYWLVVGRLTEEKGILPLVRDWPDGPRLKVVGSGPLEDEVRRIAVPAVEVLGQCEPAEVRDLMAGARGLYFPSVWPEGLPTVYLEALAAGLPVVASRQSIVASLVRREGTGFVTSGSVAEDIERAGREFGALHSHCRDVFNSTYTERAWLRAVEHVYAEVLAESP